jgi:hypothetical protein
LFSAGEIQVHRAEWGSDRRMTGLALEKKEVNAPLRMVDHTQASGVR